MEDELMMKASFIQKESEQLENNLEAIKQQISELEEMRNNLSSLAKSENKEILASIGKGVHVKADLKGKDLYVEVGSGVVVKKTSEETQKVIEDQIRRLNEAKNQLAVQVELYAQALNQIISEIEENRENKGKKD